MRLIAIPKNASRTLAGLGNGCGGAVVMLRDPVRRMEATWRHFYRQGVEIPFNRWVIEVCSDEHWPHDPHLRSQASFLPENGAVKLVFWDFRAISRIFGVKIRQKRQKPPLKWSKRAERCFKRRYTADLQLWRSRNG